MGSSARKIRRRQEQPGDRARLKMRTRFQSPWRDVADTIREKKLVQEYAREHPVRMQLMLWLMHVLFSPIYLERFVRSLPARSKRNWRTLVHGLRHGERWQEKRK